MSADDPASQSSAQRLQGPLRGRTLRVGGSVVLAALLVSPLAGGSETEESAETLLKSSKELAEAWSFFSAENDSRLEETWTVVAEGDPEEPVVRCTGKPFGYLRGKKSYENFELSLEWKYPADENGNSGVFLHTIDPDKIWPRSIQVQLHTPTAGSILPNDGAQTDQVVVVKNLKLPVNTWHKCLVRSRNGTLEVFINDKKVSEVSGCTPAKGNIALQSEGSEIHFRRIVVKEIKPPAESAAAPTET